MQRSQNLVGGALVATVVLASVLRTIVQVPPSFFGQKAHVFNVLFVKNGWAWTSLPAFLDFYQHPKLQPFLRWASFTASWLVISYGFLGYPSIISIIQHSTMVCSSAIFATAETCALAGHHWAGTDISGHCFLLVHSILYLVEEHRISTLAVHSHFRKYSNLTIFKFSLMFLWYIMFLSTTLYFHSVFENMVGVFFGIIPWILMYAVAEGVDVAKEKLE